ncbi:helix-turn-helix domain-containing protein [Actinobaculum suis]|uniref:helix-turn-helix domain-containing protein n=1 Tax=Actinobaculum suis TaxID=1657 RepID=UPI00082913E2|nr:helix-turn-helix domain-containing protein [Actinobaculum suis]OCA96049.1 hypothetical protein ACU20_03295 [Actinobaculum suis]
MSSTAESGAKANMGAGAGVRGTGTPEEIYELTAEQLDVMANPQRMAILTSLMFASPQRQKDLAADLDRTPNSLAYHIKKLQQAGLIHEANVPGADGREIWWEIAPVVGWKINDRELGQRVVTQLEAVRSSEHARYMENTSAPKTAASAHEETVPDTSETSGTEQTPVTGAATSKTETPRAGESLEIFSGIALSEEEASALATQLIDLVGSYRERVGKMPDESHRQYVLDLRFYPRGR